MPYYDLRGTRQSGIDSILQAIDQGRKIEESQWDRQHKEEQIQWERDKQKEQSRIRAIQYQGQKEYERVFKERMAAGLDEAEASRVALIRAAPQLFYAEPAKMTTVFRALKPSRIDLPEIIGEDGERFFHTGSSWQRIPKGRTAVGKPAPLTPLEKVDAEIALDKYKQSIALPLKTNAAKEANAILRDDYRRIAERVPPSGIPITKSTRTNFTLGDIPKMTEMQPSGSRIQSPVGSLAIPNISTSPPMPAVQNLSQNPITVRRKSDGKILVYRGSAADIPLDQYEIVQ